MRSFARHLLPLFLFFALCDPLAAQIRLIFPTPNENLYEHPEEFYMHTARAGADAWKGGMYGFTRDAKNTSAGLVYTRFHEGVDIAPTMRDGRGVPLDSVVAVDDGVVVHVNAVAGHSNYGKYIVVKHIWDGSPFYTLYAHLNETWVDSGEVVPKGTPLGRLGYTGAGINRARAHLHFEITMVLNQNFQKWYDEEFGDGNNRHSYFNGMNLAGLNVPRLYERLREEPDLSIQQFIAEEHPFFYSVLIPRTSRLDLLARYPWLLKRSASVEDLSWKISFDDSGVPIAVEPSPKEVKKPTLDSIADSPFSYSYNTKSRVSGSKGKGNLTNGGIRYMELIAVEPDSATLAAMEGLFAESPIPEPDIRSIPRSPRQPPPPVAGVSEGIATTGSESAGGELERDPTWPEPSGEEWKAGELIRSDWHLGNYEFLWEISPKNLTTELTPIRLRIASEDDDRDGVGVESLAVTCPELSRYGLAPPIATRISETIWSIRLGIKNKKTFASRLRELDGKIFILDLRIQAVGIEEESQVRLETKVKQ